MNEHAWTELELERYVDGDLPDERMATLARALRQDPDLRARVAAIRDADIEIRAQLLVEPEIDASDASVISVAFIRRACAVAACFVILLGMTVLVIRTASRPNPQHADHGPSTDAILDVSAPADPDAGVRILWAFNVAPPNEDHDTDPPEGTEQPTANAPTHEVETVAPSTDTASYARRVPAIDRMQPTDALLSGLSGTDRVAMCATLVRDHRHRTAAFQELRTLCESNHDLRMQVRDVTDGLRRDPSMRGWIKSYLDPALSTS